MLDKGGGGKQNIEKTSKNHLGEKWEELEGRTKRDL